MIDRTVYMPGGTPCPEVLTLEEVVRFLRLDETGVADPGETVQYYRQRGLLKTIQIGRFIRYPLPEVVAFVRNKVQEEPR